MPSFLHGELDTFLAALAAISITIPERFNLLNLVLHHAMWFLSVGIQRCNCEISNCCWRLARISDITQNGNDRLHLQEFPCLFLIETTTWFESCLYTCIVYITKEKMESSDRILYRDLGKSFWNSLGRAPGRHLASRMSRYEHKYAIAPGRAGPSEHYDDRYCESD